VLIGAGGLASMLVLPGALAAEAAGKLKVVVAGGHPGDPEYCGGQEGL